MKRVQPAVATLIVAVVFLAFSPALRNDFVAWDDRGMIVENPNFRGFSPSHLGWMFTTLYYGHYQPLSWLTLALDHALWGLDPTGYHLTSLVLHAANAVVFYGVGLAVLRRTPLGRTGAAALQGAAAAAALFFAIHPLRVESVAWASERRDVLSGLFYLLTVLTYLRRQDAPTLAARQRWLALSLAFFVLSLLSKAWGMTLPAVLLALDVYPLRRFTADPAERRRALLEKIPYLVLALGAAGMALRAQASASDLTLVSLAQHTPGARLAQAAYGLTFYLWKTVWPVRLSPLYLLDSDFDPAEPRYVLCALGVLGMTVGAMLLWRRRPWVPVVWLSYVAIVSPVLGFAQSGMQITADRYTYLALLPVALLLGAAVCWLWSPTTRTAPGYVGATVVVAALALLGTLTCRQVMIWKDTETLWTHTIAIDPRNHVAHANRAWSRQVRGDLHGALADLNEALRLNPRYALAYNTRGAVRRRMGDPAGAAADYEEGIRVAPPGSSVQLLLRQNLAALRGRPLEVDDAR